MLAQRLPLNIIKNCTCQFDTLSESQAHRVPQPQQVEIRDPALAAVAAMFNSILVSRQPPELQANRK